MITIDGSQGEGGGQVLRTALGLAMLRGEPVRIENIRAGRKKPGLMRQHLACVKAAVALSGGEADGAAIGSTTITFTPDTLIPGHHRIDIGSAGSTTLVLQTVLPALLLSRSSRGETSITVTGGTHNPLAPPAPFFEHCFLPALRKFGADVDFVCDRVGFFPRGGGSVTLVVRPVETLQRVKLHDPGREIGREAEVLIGSLPFDVVEREVQQLRKGLARWPADAIRVTQLPPEVGPANAVVLRIDHEHTTEVIVSLGERGRSAQSVANDAVSQVRSWIKQGVPVGRHLADQLLIPLALAGGSFTSACLDAHAQTNAAVIGQMLGSVIEQKHTGKTVRFTCEHGWTSRS